MRGNLPTVYDGIYRAAYSYGMSKHMTQQLVKLLASDVDFQSRLKPADRIEVFFSQPDGNDEMSDDSELLYVSATFGGNTRNLYRFQMEDGTFDYFDEDGRSAKQFLLRNPLPNGKFRSGFGGRRHPILGYTKMHTGVDWAAPTRVADHRGRQRRRREGRLGRRLRQADDHPPRQRLRDLLQPPEPHSPTASSPARASGRARSSAMSASTGLSTGAHLHYELIVNDRKVDPMRVRLPVGKVLKGERARGLQERARPASTNCSRKKTAIR